MVQLTKEQRVFVVSRYLETKSYQAVRVDFQQRFPGRAMPCKSTIDRNVKKYLEHGTSLNLNRQFSGRRRTARSGQNIADVREEMLANPRNFSLRRNNLNLSRCTIQRIISQDLKWHPYKIFTRHALQPNDFQRRITFSRWFEQAAFNPRFLRRVVIGDEATFSMNGKVSSQNVRMYAPHGNRPDFTYEVSNCREKLSVWVGLCGNSAIIGPYFFDGTVNGRKYLDMLETFVFPSITNAYQADHGNDGLFNVWWFQDGAPAHRLRDVRNRLVNTFGNRLVALGTAVEWPARSPDLTPLDFFLWGYLKSKVYATPPQNIAELRRRITEEINLLRHNPQFVINSIREMRRRTTFCIQQNGHHVEGV